ncbi:hypothetical protein AVEN_103764-1 [Araneus ventricosus]|uniref:Uncharacterized protein n=1 Tax=Araneus ventricosus TaxID=182803 RepID=A0A4Y2M443_ARAVE|nr:hypothetical protein AVEN_103764-1 [Araneus ventricosus]
MTSMPRPTENPPNSKDWISLSLPIMTCAHKRKTRPVSLKIYYALVHNQGASMPTPRKQISLSFKDLAVPAIMSI